MVVYDDGTANLKLLFFTNTGDCWLYEDPNAIGDAGAATVPVAITTHTLDGESVLGLSPEKGIWVAKCGIEVDDCGPSSYADVTATYDHTGQQACWWAENGNGLSLDGRGRATVWRRTADLPFLFGDDDGVCPHVQLSLTAGMPSGVRIHSFYAFVEDRTYGEDYGDGS